MPCWSWRELKFPNGTRKWGSSCTNHVKLQSLSLQEKYKVARTLDVIVLEPCVIFFEIQVLALKKLDTSKVGGEISDNPTVVNKARITSGDLDKFGSTKGTKIWYLQASDHATKNF